MKTLSTQQHLVVKFADYNLGIKQKSSDHPMFFLLFASFVKIYVTLLVSNGKQFRSGYDNTLRAGAVRKALRCGRITCGCNQ